MKAAAYRNYLLALLLVVYAFNQVDRLALGLVLQDIKAALSLSDTQLGLLTGIAFASFYSIMGIPIARWADRGNRITILTLTTALWSAMVALCGLAASFLQLILLRAGVAIGEAGCLPPAHSLIADYFERAERPRAVAIFMLAGPLSVLIGFFLAGWLNQFYGWRTTFVLLGLPGLLLATLVRFTLREPRCEQEDSPSMGHTGAVQEPSLKDVCVTLWTNRTFCHLLLCFAVMSFFSYGIGQWQPAFFIRSYGLQTGALGTWFTVIYGGGGLVGTYLGGVWTARWAARNERRQLLVMAGVYSTLGIVSICTYLSPNQSVAFALITVAAVGGGATVGPLFATIQTLVPPRMRAMSIAIIFFFANLIGMGLGPLAAGALSDLFRSYFAEESLRYALLTLCPGYFWGAWHVWRGSGSVIHELEAVQVL